MRRRCATLKVLVVDDNREGCDTMTLLFRTLKHIAEAAYCGQDAIKKAYEMRPDFILLDIGMPDMSGWEVTQALRKDDSFKDMKIYALSGYSDATSVQRSYDVGMNYHFVKPMDDLQVLWDILKKHGLLA